MTWTTVAATTSWDLYDIQQATVTNPIIGIRIVTDTDAVWVDLDQLENQMVPTSPIITAATTVTRNKDELTIQQSGNFLPTVGSLLYKVTPGFDFADMGSLNAVYISSDTGALGGSGRLSYTNNAL